MSVLEASNLLPASPGDRQSEHTISSGGTLTIETETQLHQPETVASTSEPTHEKLSTTNGMVKSHEATSKLHEMTDKDAATSAHKIRAAKVAQAFYHAHQTGMTVIEKSIEKTNIFLAIIDSFYATQLPSGESCIDHLHNMTVLIGPMEVAPRGLRDVVGKLLTMVEQRRQRRDVLTESFETLIESQSDITTLTAGFSSRSAAELEKMELNIAERQARIDKSASSLGLELNSSPKTSEETRAALAADTVRGTNYFLRSINRLYAHEALDGRQRSVNSLRTEARQRDLVARILATAELLKREKTKKRSKELADDLVAYTEALSRTVLPDYDVNAEDEDMADDTVEA